MPRLILFNKPYGVLCQFSGGGGRGTLADFITAPGVYPAGRLDRDSEGLLVLTDSGPLQHRLTDPRHKVWKTYWAQVEGDPDIPAIDRLRQGPMLRDGPTRPARVLAMAEPDLWARSPPVRFRRQVPTRWLEIAIREGRNRQVRRMTAAAGHPTLRLVRVAVGRWRLGRLGPGEWTVLTLPDPPVRGQPERGRRMG